MTNPTEASNALDSTAKLIRFLAGTTLGLLLVAIPFFASGLSLGAVTGVQIGVGAIAVLACGVLGLAFGEKFVNGVMKVLEGMGGY